MHPAAPTARTRRGAARPWLVAVVALAVVTGGTVSSAASAEVAPVVPTALAPAAVPAAAAPAVAPAAAAAGAPGSFSDVPVDHAFYGEVEWMAVVGISTGYPDERYRPASAVSRQAMAAFLYRFAFEPDFTPPARPTFRDVPTSSPFYAEVEWLAAEGISDGFADGTFRPGAPVSRQAMSAFLLRVVDGGGYTGPRTPSFADVPTSSPFYDSVEWMQDNGVSDGWTSGTRSTFRPSATVTRQAMSAFMYRADDLL